MNNFYLLADKDTGTVLVNQLEVVINNSNNKYAFASYPFFTSGNSKDKTNFIRKHTYLLFCSFLTQKKQHLVKILLL